MKCICHLWIQSVHSGNFHKDWRRHILDAHPITLCVREICKHTYMFVFSVRHMQTHTPHLLAPKPFQCRSGLLPSLAPIFNPSPLPTVCRAPPGMYKVTELLCRRSPKLVQCRSSLLPAWLPSLTPLLSLQFAEHLLGCRRSIRTLSVWLAISSSLALSDSYVLYSQDSKLGGGGNMPLFVSA